MTTPSSVPAQGEAMEVLRELVALHNGGRVKDGPVMSTGEFWQWVKKHDALWERARALVAASPCEAEPDWPAGWPESWKRLPRESLQRLRDDPPCGHMLRGVRKDYCARCQRAAIAPARAEATTAILDKVEHLLCVASDAGKAEAAGDAATTERLDMELKRGVEAIEQALVAAAQGGQQPAGVTFPMPDKPGLTMACFDAQTVPVRTPLYTAPAPAAQGGQQPVAEVRLTLGMPIIEWVGRDYPVGTKLYTGPTAAPLTEARVIEIARATESAEPGRDGYILPITFARAILAEVGITLAGTAQKGGEDA